VVVAAGAVLRLWGIRWGLPNADRLCTYHPDEGVNLFNGVLAEGVARPHLDIGFYNYGSLYFLLWQVAVAANSAYGLVSIPPAPAADLPATESLASMMLVGRLLTACLGVATCIVLWGYGRATRDPRGGVIAAALWAVCPLAVVHGHFATVDVTATFLVACTMVASVQLLDRKTFAWAAVSGLFVGLSAAARYNVAASVVMPLAAVLLRAGTGRRPTLRHAAALAGTVIACAVAGFLIGCPGAVLNWPKFSADVLFEARKSAEGMGLLFQGTGNGWLYHYASSLRHGLGIALLATVTVGAVVSLGRRKPGDVVLLLFVVTYYGLMGAAHVRFARYMLPVLPALFLLTGGLPEAANRWRPARVGAWCLICAGALHACFVATGLSVAMGDRDPRDRAAAFITRSLRPGASVAFGTTPWYWSPPLMPEFTAPIPGAARRTALLVARGRYVLRLPGPEREWDLTALGDPAPDAVVVSDLESQDALRLRRPEVTSFLERAAQGRRKHVFDGRPSVLGLPVVSGGYLPNDLLYVCPRVSVYMRR